MLVAKINRNKPFVEKMHLADVIEEGVYENGQYIVLVFSHGIRSITNFRYLFITKEENYKYIYDRAEILSHKGEDNTSYWVTLSDAEITLSEMDVE